MPATECPSGRGACKKLRGSARSGFRAMAGEQRASRMYIASDDKGRRRVPGHTRACWNLSSRPIPKRLRVDMVSPAVRRFYQSADLTPQAPGRESPRRRAADAVHANKAYFADRAPIFPPKWLRIADTLHS